MLKSKERTHATAMDPVLAYHRKYMVDKEWSTRTYYDGQTRVVLPLLRYRRIHIQIPTRHKIDRCKWTHSVPKKSQSRDIQAILVRRSGYKCTARNLGTPPYKVGCVVCCIERRRLLWCFPSQVTNWRACKTDTNNTSVVSLSKAKSRRKKRTYGIPRYTLTPSS